MTRSQVQVLDRPPFLRALVVQLVTTSPCHGEDRRFESGRARQIKCPTVVGLFIFANLWQKSYLDLFAVQKNSHVEIHINYIGYVVRRYGATTRDKLDVEIRRHVDIGIHSLGIVGAHDRHASNLII